KGDPGPAGPAGPPGVSGYQIVTGASALQSGPTNVANAVCPPGKRVLGGGADIDGVLPSGAIESNPDVFLNDSQSVTINGQQGWGGVAREDDIGYDQNWRITAYAICALVAP